MMVLKAHPKVGERVVKITHVTDWIESKLQQEFVVGYRTFRNEFVAEHSAFKGVFGDQNGLLNFPKGLKNYSLKFILLQLQQKLAVSL